MPIKTSFVTEDIIRGTALPNHGKSYTVIPHSYIIDQTLSQLKDAGLEVVDSLYKSTLDGQVAQGIYHLKKSNDPDMTMMFAWCNSYNKMMRFKCAIGGRVIVCDNGMVSGDLASYDRIHKGSALHDALDSIQFQIKHADEYYDNLVSDKEMLKGVILTRDDQASIIGQLYASLDVVTLTQVGIIRREMDKPSFQYNSDENSAWSLYNHVTLALKDSHPLTYLKNHQAVHQYFVDQMGQLRTKKEDPSYTGPEQEAFIVNESPKDLDVALNELVTTGFGVQFN